MATVERTTEQTIAEQRFLLRGISWRTYESLLADLVDQPTPRMTYDRGSLELMAPSHAHERYKHLLEHMITFWATEKRTPIHGGGSTTFRRADLDRGLEPDECYYLRNEPLVRGKEEIDLSIDPPPDLAVEVELSSGALDKMQIYAALRVPELWRFDGEILKGYELAADGEYHLREGSPHLPDFPVQAAPEWIARAKETDEGAWARAFMDWIRTQS